ncbi:glycoside hydrolase family 3 N-terminal domain-containing protein [Marinifilum fragile]|uniref:glycoside hydrolase family 3 N-terminal domain-containing protein n=1 Tax=Marinifilum fragile TaxID=570161 RepID=UPI002AAA800B|nr:glycoside hydrolase family 3 N-terminal domain-containing protein [Marinifilum fragile]
MLYIFSPKRILILFFFYLLAFSLAAQNYVQDQYLLVDQLNRSNHWADSIFSTMSEDEKISQLFMIAAYSNKSKKETERIAAIVDQYQIGGIIFFHGEPGKQAELSNWYQSLSKVPMWLGMDAENGLGMRLKETISYPRQLMLGAVQDNELIYRLGKQIGKECKRLGVHVNFAPVMDVNNNPANPVINSRSFGEDRYNVANKSYAFANGMQSSGVIAVGKHFPGHGDTDIDSHVDLPILNHNRARLDSIELYPFKKVIAQGLGGIMISHLNVPALDPNQKVATLSRPIVSDLLKDELGFKGLVFTDALNMQGVRKYYNKGKVDVKALTAGNDVLLFTEDVEISLKEIKAAIENGELSWDEINEKCKKILKAKYWLGLSNYKPIDTERLWSGLNTQEGFILRRQLAEQSITLLKNDRNLLPLKRLDTLKVASIAVGASIRNRFQEYLGRYTDIDFYQIEKDASKEHFEILKEKLDKYNLLIVSMHDTDQRPSKNFGITDQTVQLLSEISANKKVVFDLFGNPYALDRYRNLNDLDAVLVSYQDSKEAQMASAQIVFGGLAAKGKLPVTVNDDFRVGAGIETIHNRLGYSLPEQVGLSTLKLNVIDSIAEDAIKQKATPGCQILIARSGKVVFNKSYGYHTYARKRPVRNPDIYDLASLTKITATLPVLMQMTDEGWIDVDANIGKYYSKAKESNKDSLILRKILAHEARLLSWKPFHWEAVDSASFKDNLFSRTYSRRYSLKLGKNLYIDRNYKFKKGILSKVKSETYPIEVAKNLYINKNFKDTILQGILDSDYREKNGYKYSDLGFILMGEMIQERSGEPVDSYVSRHFYRQLGAGTLGYRPQRRFSLNRIVPTQKDDFFRKQWIKGYVHDPTSAMLGGVAGHAGMFGNASDLAKLAQMYLQKGEYGSEMYIGSETIEKFTSRAYPDGENRRGIGFDKPFLDPTDKNGPTSNLASLSSYGHTGFTGTMIWIDPDYDLVYIFLSNRICPDESNAKLMEMDVRTKIQECIYKAVRPEITPARNFSDLLVSPLDERIFN